MSRVKEQLLNDRTFKRAVSPEEPCEARQMSDQMNCTRCGLVWDMNDPDRPECRQRKNPPERGVRTGRALVTGQGAVSNVDRFSAPNHVDLARAKWKQKDRSVGHAHLEQMRQKLGD